MHPHVTYFIILLSVFNANDFTHQGESAVTQWVNSQTTVKFVINMNKGLL